MAHFDDIYDIAADEYGIVTAARAREAGAAPSELNRWCTDGRLLRRGHGVYKLARWVPTPYDAYAEAVALVGDRAYLHGLAVLAMHGLALVDPRAIEVATGPTPPSPWATGRSHPSPGPGRRGPGSPWCGNASHEYAFRTPRRTPDAPGAGR